MKTRSITFPAICILSFAFTSTAALALDCDVERTDSRNPDQLTLSELSNGERNVLTEADADNDGVVSRDEYVLVCRNAPDRYTTYKNLPSWAKK